jgi:hypothetical protein
MRVGRLGGESAIEGDLVLEGRVGLACAFGCVSVQESWEGEGERGRYVP